MKLCMMAMMTGAFDRQNYRVEDFIKAAVKLDITAIDWIGTHGRKAEELRKMTDDAGLEVAGHTFFLQRFYNGEKNWMDEVKESLDNAVKLGAPLVMIPTPGAKDRRNRNEYRKEWIDALSEIMPLTKTAGLILTVENFPGKYSPFVLASDFLEAQAQIPELKLTFDNGNAASGENVVDSFMKTAEFTVHCHFKDWDILNHPEENYRELLDGRYYRSALIGEGSIDTKACWNAMRDYDYKGFINIEYEGDTYMADDAFSKASRYLRSL